MSHTTVEVVVFPYAQFQACVITGKAEVEWPLYNLQELIYIPSFFFLVLRHDSNTPTWAGEHQLAEKTVKEVEHMVTEHMIRDATCNIHRKCKACKQA